VTLREGVLRDWVALSVEERRAVAKYGLHYVLNKQSSAPPPQFVTAQLLATSASVLKRGWVEDAAAFEAFFGEMHQAVGALGSDAAKRVALQQLAAVVSEFSPGTASAMGMPYEFHERCRVEFEARYLQQFFGYAMQLAREAAGGGTRPPNPSVAISHAHNLKHSHHQLSSPPFRELVGDKTCRPTRFAFKRRSGLPSAPNIAIARFGTAEPPVWRLPFWFISLRLNLVFKSHQIYLLWSCPIEAFSLTSRKPRSRRAATPNDGMGVEYTRARRQRKSKAV
jgi:hypothetical protein